MNSEKYPNGYLPKIEFWEAKYVNALEEGMRSFAAGNINGGKYWNEKAMEANRKLMYFRGREVEVYSSENIW